MTRLSLWKKQKTKDYHFIDKLSKEQFYVGGVSIYVHKYLGPQTTDETSVVSGVAGANDAGKPINETTIQDLLFMENRDRRYDPNVYELRGHFTVSDNDFNLAQFGLMLANDNIYVTFHLNDMVDIIGRKLMNGDVLEMPNMRDDLLLNEESPAINKYYQINSADFSAEGYSPTWWRHLWRCGCSPLVDSQEYQDILGTGANPDDLKNLLSTYSSEIAISGDILTAAQEQVPFRNFETAQFYFVPGSDELGSEVLPGNLAMPAILTSSDQPIDGMQLLGSGQEFPKDAEDGTYFLRTDYEPYVLFKKSNKEKGWIQISVDYRRTWSAAHRILETFLKNDHVWTDIYDEPVKEKIDLKKAVLPRSDV